MTTESSAVEPGLYRHFKGGLYMVLFTGKHSEDESVQVIYRNHKGEVWVRPLAMWNEVTDRWPDGVPRPRFVPAHQVNHLFSNYKCCPS